MHTRLEAKHLGPSLFLVNPVAFPAVLLERGGVRFSISRSHTEIDIRNLLAAITAVARMFHPSDELRPEPATVSLS